MNNSKQKITTFLMFQDGNAEEVMNFYISLFDNSKIVNIIRYGANEAGQEGTVMHAVFSLNGQEYMCIDSYVKHEFTFTPAMSLYVTCDSKEEIDKVFEKLSEGGKILMPLDTYPFSERFGWVNDKYGVSWQLSFEK
ncbi:VOC family protein [Desulfitobacterium hafniense]|uniref:VOC family protein n=1 Tax=Desulfitobacterium hafniense TaxID=49338 RepID=UPI0003759D8B|nr:VOC family protein [Desulfitobacterium hafniense]